MRRGDLADLTAFVAVADLLSFRAAAARLGVTPSALSHTVRQLEERLGVRLLHRTTRSVSPTDAGHRLLERLRPAIEQIASAVDDLGGEQHRPFGNLRIAANPTAAVTAIAPIWARYLSTHPDVHLEVRIDEAPIDIVSMGFDAGIGPRDWPSADMTIVRVAGPMKVALVASPAYFARRSPPRTPDDLARHKCVQYRRGVDGSMLVWSFEHHGERRVISVDGQVMVNNVDLALQAAVDGLGIVYTLEAKAEAFLRSGLLVRVLEDWSPSFEGMFLYYPGHRQVPTALRALIDMIQTSRNSPATGISSTNPFIEA